MSRPPIHPGEILADDLDEIGMTASELARRIDVPPNRISEIIRGRRGVTGDTALRLGHWFGTTPQLSLRANNLRLSQPARV
jgi:addiction module HigA family antidote